jgi:hypothetical protein
MKMLLCPKGYVATKVSLNGAWLDVHIDMVTPEERGYTLVDDTIAQILLQRPGYEAVPERTYPRSIEELKEKVGKELLAIGILRQQPIVPVDVATLPPDTQRHIRLGRTGESQEARRGTTPHKNWWTRITQIFRRR